MHLYNDTTEGYTRANHRCVVSVHRCVARGEYYGVSQYRCFVSQLRYFALQLFSRHSSQEDFDRRKRCVVSPCRSFLAGERCAEP